MGKPNPSETVNVTVQVYDMLRKNTIFGALLRFLGPYLSYENPVSLLVQNMNKKNLARVYFRRNG